MSNVSGVLCQVLVQARPGLDNDNDADDGIDERKRRSIADLDDGNGSNGGDNRNRRSIDGIHSGSWSNRSFDDRKKRSLFDSRSSFSRSRSSFSRFD